MESGVAVIDARRATAGSFVTIVNGVTTVVDGGNSASVTIGGQPVRDSSPPPALDIRRPRGGDLTLTGLSETCRIGTVASRRASDVTSGDCRVA
ncbi:MAG: hypothetical protein FD153_2062 [Rhodospirillaceae bacterium]|nr:MAG: hypothetical protein FD153_2062 [Rhodospirillaceae bacterium]